MVNEFESKTDSSLLVVFERDKNIAYPTGLGRGVIRECFLSYAIGRSSTSFTSSCCAVISRKASRPPLITHATSSRTLSTWLTLFGSLQETSTNYMTSSNPSSNPGFASPARRQRRQNTSCSSHHHNSFSNPRFPLSYSSRVFQVRRSQYGRCLWRF